MSKELSTILSLCLMLNSYKLLKDLNDIGQEEIIIDVLTGLASITYLYLY